MAHEIKMQKLDTTMQEVILAQWMKTEKSRVEEGEVLFAIESDKVTYEVASPESGILLILVETGRRIPVGTTLGFLAQSEEEYGDLKRKAAGRGETGADTIARGPQPFAAGAEADFEFAPAQAGRIRATPGARKLARQQGIDLTTVRGTGPQGRITRKDILAVPERAPAFPEAPAETKAHLPYLPAELKHLDREEPMSSMRATISSRMMQSLQTSAQITAFSEWDFTELMKLRSLINRSEGETGYRVTVLGLMVLILARVLKETPIFNASVEGDKIRYWDAVNIGVAVALPHGLVVPVIHGADRKSLREIQLTLEELASRAHEGKLLAENMKGGTFTLSNLGSYGGDWETVILNPPEVGILGFGKVTQKPVVIDQQIVVREMLPVSLTYDHRIIDGATAGKFRQRMKALIENPGLAITCLGGGA